MNIKQFGSAMLATLLLLAQLSSGIANAGVISTQASVNSEITYDREAFSEALETVEAKQKLLAYGVSEEDAQARLASLTDAELVQLNESINTSPAGEGALGVVLTVFIVFVITDMLCATDLFYFVKCIN